MEITELVERLERVEKANQRLRLAGGAMVAVLLGPRRTRGTEAAAINGQKEPRLVA